MLDVHLIADVWGWLVPAVIIFIYVINHLWSAAQGPDDARRQQQRRRPAPGGQRPVRPQQAAGQAGGQPAQPPAQAQLNAEIEQFLKRANERRTEKAVRESAPSRQAPPVAPPREAEQPLDVELLEPHDFDAVAGSVQKHFRGRSLDEHSDHDVDDGRLAADFERHKQQVFSQRLGRLGGGLTETETPDDDASASIGDRDATAKAVAGLLANQQSIRQAVVLKEILDRPADRW